MGERGKTPFGIYLVGFMGAGKSTAGRLLAKRLGWRFVDVDAEIEARVGMSIAELFAREGEACFREWERKAVVELAAQVKRGSRVVAALGGGAYARSEVREALRGAGVAIWLDWPLEVLAERVKANPDRPLARDARRFRELYELRRAAYAEAEYHLELSRETPEEIVEAVLGLELFPAKEEADAEEVAQGRDEDFPGGAGGG